MRMIFNDLESALSVKSCYSRFLSSIAVILLMFLLSAAFMVDRHESKAALAQTVALFLSQE